MSWLPILLVAWVAFNVVFVGFVLRSARMRSRKAAAPFGPGVDVSSLVDAP